MPWFALGLGSNVLLPDEGLDALVIRLGKGLDRLDQAGERLDRRRRAAGAARRAARRRRRAGPGCTRWWACPAPSGGGVFMNAGCHGAEWSDVVESVTGGGAQRRGSRRSRREHSLCLPPERPRRVRWCSRPTVELRAGGSEPLIEAELNELFRWRSGGDPVQPALLRQRLQESRDGASRHREGGRGPPAADRGRRAEGVPRSVARRCPRCTPTTSSTPAGRPRRMSGALIARRAGDGPGPLRRDAGARGQD